MRKSIVLVTVFYFLQPFYSSAKNSNIFGAWKFVNAKCENNKVLSKAEKAKIQLIVSMNYSRHLLANGILIDSLKNLSANTEAGKISCSVKQTIPYTLSDHTFSLSKTNSHIEVNCDKNNQEIETALKNEFTKKTNFHKQEFKHENKKLLFFSSFNQKIQDIDCGAKVRLVSEFEPM